MSYVKYREDDKKIVENRLFMQGKGTIQSSKPVIRYYDCKYCKKIFNSKADLFSHIRNVHNIVRPLIVINDKVVGDNVIVQYIDSARIIRYGYEDCILINGTSLRNRDSEEIDITHLLKKALNSNDRCEITFSDSHVTIEIQPIRIEDNSMMKKTIASWQTAVATGQSLNDGLLNSFTDANLKFMQGVYNYFIACTAQHYKASRYDEAFALLSQFHELNGIGRCILKAIAFRRNWISSLQMLTNGQSDIFSTASEYYSGQCSSFAYESDPSAEQLFVEDGTQLSLELISLFQKGMYSEVKKRLASLGDIDDQEDLNLIEQLNLLHARLAVIDGDRTTASRYYERLITPAFRDEYRRFILNTKPTRVKKEVL